MSRWIAPAALLLLEKLSPTKRAAYVLHEAFDYPYDQIASTLQMEEANVRQLVSRACKHIADGRRTSVSPNEQRRFLEAFVAAAQKGDITALEGLFAEMLFLTQISNSRSHAQTRDLTAGWRIVGTRKLSFAATWMSAMRSDLARIQLQSKTDHFHTGFCPLLCESKTPGCPIRAFSKMIFASLQSLAPRDFIRHLTVEVH